MRRLSIWNLQTLNHLRHFQTFKSVLVASSPKSIQFVRVLVNLKFYNFKIKMGNQPNKMLFPRDLWNKQKIWKMKDRRLIEGGVMEGKILKGICQIIQACHLKHKHKLLKGNTPKLISHINYWLKILAFQRPVKISNWRGYRFRRRWHIW